MKNGSGKAFHAVLDLSASRLTRLSNDNNEPRDGFIVAKNGRSYQFSASNKQIADHWISRLKSVCVLTAFYEEYETLKMIGTGGFAKVGTYFYFLMSFYMIGLPRKIKINRKTLCS